MTAYVFAVEDGVTKHYDRVQALAYAGTLDPHGLVVAAKDDLPATGSEDLAEIYYRLATGSLIPATDVSRTMVFKAITDTAPSSFTEPTAVKNLPDNTPTVEPKGTKTMSEARTADTATQASAAPAKAPKKTAAAKAPKKAAAAKAPKAKAEPKPRVGKGKPAGKAADFGQVLKGSKRANILELMTGKYDTKEIGAKLGIPASLVSSNIFCLHRDIGVGYEYGKDGKINALFPAGKSMSDAMRAPAEKKAAAPKAPKAAAKKAPVKKAAAKK